MGRLIDADKFIEWLDMGHLRNPSEVCLNELNVLGMIIQQHTAYDVDKVVEQMVTGSICVRVDDEPFIMLDEAIEIVKGAVKDE